MTLAGSLRAYVATLGVFFVALHTLTQFGTGPSPTSAKSRHLSLQHDKQEPKSSQGQHDDESIEKMRSWRNQYQQLCQDERSTKEDLLRSLSELLQPRTGASSEPNNDEPCKYTILDFGANVGDSLGKFIDSGIEPCPGKDLDKNPPRLDLDTIRYSNDNFHKRGNPLIRSSRSIWKQVESLPEWYCYYGVEGNPRFTPRLLSLEERFNHDVLPQPMRRVRFLTQTVGAGKDGPTKIYLDTVNEAQNFWGSSILPAHKDVVKSDGSVQAAASVEGITLSTLLLKTAQKVEGGHVLIKMDIEGGEYAVLDEAYQRGVLCDYAQSNVTIHLILETHRPDVIGESNFDLEKWRNVKQSLRDCGVILQTGRDAGR
ncbi:expressed unknown protein [Seminavis robusta]|uniref:Methyltransferase FkbM domain-containing protein n=1 Tax=Seminavis robusta TaxID=568900 RepID=A0A9N8DP04_9STRA|nr:expressed unknown protein [Seminavis robusta]|eukprot:Sro268_g103830.1 n/a (371) ;mRNA; r:76683-77795